MEMMDDETTRPADRLADDLLDGGAEIAEFLGRPLREVYHLAKTKRLPIGRLGRKLFASPATVTGPHYHSWALNRRFFKGVTKAPRLLDATPYPGAGRSFDAILRWFCTDTNIESLPPDHRIEPPPPGFLL